MGKNNLEERMVNFAVAVLGIAEKMKKTYTGNDLSTQLIRSSTSAVQNYGEAESAGSRKDFIHKIKVVLKELRETMVSLKIVQRTILYPDEISIQSTIQECNELISIFVTSVKTAAKNLEKEKNKNSI